MSLKFYKMTKELQHIEKTFNRDLKFKNKEDWYLNENLEKDLEYELSLERKILEKDREEFENVLSKDDDVIRPTTNNFMEKTIILTQSKEGQYSLKKLNTIQSIYIIVKRTTCIKSLLDSKLRLQSLGNYLIDDFVWQLILIQMFYDKNIIEDIENDEYQIPILDFTLITNNKSGKGFPNDRLMSSHIEIYPRNNHIKLLITDKKEVYDYTISEYFFPDNKNISKIHSSSSNYFIFTTSPINSKYICIYFLGDVQPYIENAKLSCLCTDKEMFWEGDDILTITILERKIFILPLTKEFSTWENILDSFKDVDENILKTPFYSSRFSMLSFTTNIDIDKSDIKIISSGVKLLSVSCGVAGFRYI